MDILCELSKKNTAPFRRQRQGDIMRHHWLTPCPRPGRVLLPRCDLRDAAQRAGLDLEPSAERAAESWSPVHSKHFQRMLKHYTYFHISNRFKMFQNVSGLSKWLQHGSKWFQHAWKWFEDTARLARRSWKGKGKSSWAKGGNDRGCARKLVALPAGDV